MMPLGGLRVLESANLHDRLLVMDGNLYIPTNHTGWTTGYYLAVLLCGDLRWPQ